MWETALFLFRGKLNCGQSECCRQPGLILVLNGDFNQVLAVLAKLFRDFAIDGVGVPDDVGVPD